MSRPTLTEDITRVLRNEVLSGRYRPGERLPSERDLAARFETTRGIARVALKKLEQLGIASVEPGGARVEPFQNASLEVVGHLLELEGPPAPELVDQVLEVLGSLLATSTRLSVEQAKPEQRAHALRLIQSLLSGEVPEAELHAHVHELSHAFFDSNDNAVMQIVRRSLRTELFGRLHELGIDVHVVDQSNGRPTSAGRGIFTRLSEIEPYVRELERAIEHADGLAGYEAMHQIWVRFHGWVRNAVQAARADGVSESGGAP